MCAKVCWLQDVTFLVCLLLSQQRLCWPLLLRCVTVQDHGDEPVWRRVLQHYVKDSNPEVAQQAERALRRPRLHSNPTLQPLAAPPPLPLEASPPVPLAAPWWPPLPIELPPRLFVAGQPPLPMEAPPPLPTEAPPPPPLEAPPPLPTEPPPPLPVEPPPPLPLEPPPR
jgi:hypothetical protein